MPTPGASALQAAMGGVAIPLPTYPSATIDINSKTITQVAAGMNNGWVSLYPTAVSNCETEIENAFSNRVASGWNSRCWLRALGKGIDKEMAAWVASYENGLHTYAPSSSSIYKSISAEIAICGFSNTHAYPLPQAIANAWMSFFVQEGG